MRRRDRCWAEAEGDSVGIGGEGGPLETEVHLFKFQMVRKVPGRSKPGNSSAIAAPQNNIS
jgi:hypothetical protein